MVQVVASLRPAVVFVSAVLVVGTLTACSSRRPPTVLAASSLAVALDTFADEFDITFAGSPSLIAQLDAGVQAAVLVVADAESMTKAVATRRVHGEPVVIATNRLALAVSDGNPGSVTSLADLARSDLLVGLCAPEVPCGRLATEELAEADVIAAPDTEDSSVRSLVEKLRLGELDVGLVYRTDADAVQLEVIDEPALDRRTEILAAAIDAEVSGPVTELWDYLTSTALTEHGFGPP